MKKTLTLLFSASILTLICFISACDNDTPPLTPESEWKEVARFPGEGRIFARFASQNDNGYVFSGGEYVGDGIFDLHTDIFKYNATSNQWTSLGSDDAFRNVFLNFTANGNMFFMNENFEMVVYNLETKTMTTTNPILENFSVLPAVFGFAVGNDACVGILQGNEDVSYVIKKYDASDNSWNEVASIEEVEGHTRSFTYIYQYEGQAYLLDQANNIYVFNPASNNLELVASSQMENETLKYLFTIKGLSYFMNEGFTSQSPNGIEFTEPPKQKLFIYDNQSAQWTIENHEFPETFYSVSAFTLNDRGFAGLSVDVENGTYVYSNKFYEFTPRYKSE
jgi:hypothetical protein